MADELSACSGACLVLGVTPELAELRSELIAVDRNPEMLAAVWPGDLPGRRARCADWGALPPELGPFGCVAGDGSLNVLPTTAEQRRVLSELWRVTHPDARLVVRVFVRPERGESLADVWRSPELSESFHGFKWRVAMALCATHGSTLPVAALHRAVVDRWPHRESLCAVTGWSSLDVETIDVYADSAERYSFPTRAELEHTLRSAGFEARWRDVPGYELWERCPLVVLERP